MKRLLDGTAIDLLAIRRIQEFEEFATEKSSLGYYVGDSGGKDSEVVLDLMRRSGCRYESHHNLTCADAPETIHHIREHHPETTIHRPDRSLWEVIRSKGIPPRRNARYCCETQKELGGRDRVVVLGVRWGESNRRSRRSLFESCRKHGDRWFLNPIIEWTTGDVWTYIRQRGLPYNRLYDEGFHRVGCVLCPMTRDVDRQMARWPRLCRAWERAIKSTWKPNLNLPSPEALWQWWLDRDAKAENYAECMAFEDDPGLFEEPIRSSNQPGRE
jgi:phosphoadenosine phosphosulfate reductase